MPGLNAALGGLAPDLPLVAAGFGLKTLFGIVLPPSSQVAAYVRSTGPQNGDDSAIGSNLVSTLAAGLARCRAGMGDVVFVLPGHTETGVGSTMMANLVAGTKIIGIGRGSNMPVFTWNATTDQWAVNKADVIIAGLRLRISQANGVVKGILWTGADGVLSGNDIEVATAAALKATIAVELGVGADRMVVSANKWRGVATFNVTDGLKIAGIIDQPEITDNVMAFSATAGNGNIHVAAAATEVFIARNYLHNSHTASTACIAIDDVASTGMVCDNECTTENNGTASAQGVVFAGTTNTLIKCNQNFSCDEKGKSGILAPVAAT